MSTASQFRDILIETALQQLGLIRGEEVGATYHPSLTKWFETGEDSALTEEYNAGMRFKMDIQVDVGHWTVSVYELSNEDHLVLIMENHHDEPDIWALSETEE